MFAFLSHLQNTTVDSIADMRRVRNGIKYSVHKRNATSKTMLILKHASSIMNRDRIPYSSFFVLLATVLAHTRQRLTSCWMPVTLRTATTSSSSSKNWHNEIKVQVIYNSAQRCCPRTMWTFLVLYLLCPKLWQQWTAAVPYAVLQSRWFYVCSISCNIANY